jgi:hypothetical protein
LGLTGRDLPGSQIVEDDPELTCRGMPKPPAQPYLTHRVRSRMEFPHRKMRGRNCTAHVANWPRAEISAMQQVNSDLGFSRHAGGVDPTRLYGPAARRTRFFVEPCRTATFPTHASGRGGRLSQEGYRS